MSDMSSISAPSTSGSTSTEPTAVTTVTSVLVPMPAYTEESPTTSGQRTAPADDDDDDAPPKMPFIGATIRALQVACLFVIPVFAVSLIMFMAVMAIRCDGSGGFIMTKDGTVHCVSSTAGRQLASSGREQLSTAAGVHRMNAGEVLPTNGTVVMTITRVVLISVAVFIFSFTAWICVWYQRYGKQNSGTGSPANDPSAAPIVTAGNSSSSGQVPIIEINVSVNDYLAKEDMQRLLGTDHSIAPAV